MRIDQGLLAQFRKLGLKPEPMPEADPATLMLCTLVEEAFDGAEWVFEPKLDGLRILIRFDGRRLQMISRSGESLNARFPEIAEGLRRQLKVPALLDGELTCLDENGRPSLRALQSRLNLLGADERVAQMGVEDCPAKLFLFDITYLYGFNLKNVPLGHRKHFLRRALEWRDPVRWTPVIPEAGQETFSQICASRGEGLVAKRLDSLYSSGRGESWLKVKCVHRQEFVIGGYTEPKGARTGLGALLVGYFSEDGKDLVYAGKVASGFDRQTRLGLRKRLGRIETRRVPFTKGEFPGHRGTVHWVKPGLVAEVAFDEWTRHGFLNQPRFEGLRSDKAAEETHLEKPALRVVPDPGGGEGSGSEVFPDPEVHPLESPRFEFTSLDKLMFPGAGLTKADLVDYYEQVSELLLPWLKGRPVTLERWPEGLKDADSPHFWQKNTPAYYPDWISRLLLPDIAGHSIDYSRVESLEALLYLVNQGGLCFHIWASRAGSLNRPDFLLFDLASGKASFSDVARVALELRSLLQRRGLESYVKTSGRAGLHVMAPWSDFGGYAEARAWAISVAGELAEICPKLATVERQVAKRGARVYIDTIQNAKGHHFAAPYSIRATPEASVSMPISWGELEDGLNQGSSLDPRGFTVKEALLRMKELDLSALLPPEVLIGHLKSVARPNRRESA